MLRIEGLTRRFGGRAPGYARHRLPATGMGRAFRPTQLLRHGFENVVGECMARTSSGVVDHPQAPARRQQHHSIRDGGEGERARHPEAV
jgi:hypothetical protein